MASLPPSPRHVPWHKGVYGVAPNLRLLGAERAFEFNDRWPAILANKRRQTPFRSLRWDLDEATATAVVKTLAIRAAREWPEFFTLDRALTCASTSEVVPLDATGLDALSANLPCDVAVIRRDGDRDWNAYLHVAAPSHWRPEDKIGQPFETTHRPIPHFEPVNAVAPRIVDAMIAKGPWMRFVWGIDTDEEWDHHPDRALARDFEAKPFVVRVERQVTLPLPECDAAIFLIGTGFVSRETVLGDEALWRPLHAALLGMSPEARAYKGIAEGFEALLAQFPTSLRPRNDELPASKENESPRS